ncbi:glycoside hydrolase family 31 protein [candidate division KSB1 bacterium]|nr:glycoside hydrolase family 31 protein [candidate division KSB1 bacterium]
MLKKILRRTFYALLSVILLLAVALYFLFVLPFWGIPFNGQRHGRVPLTPAWALECWLWEDDINTAERVDELLTGYAEHDIPVRTLIIDSPWSTRLNDFEVDTTRYPHPRQWFHRLQDEGYRVVLWMTSMVNSYNKDTAIRNSQDWYTVARNNGFLVGNGYQVKWWKGRGGFIDYTNPDAMQWWHGMQDSVFSWGIDGWKLDGTATFFSSQVAGVPLPYQKTAQGWSTTRHYMDRYYREEYRHGLSKNPEFVTLARSKDRPWTHPEGFAPLDAAPVTWVGDQKHTWQSSHPLDETEDDRDLVMDGVGGIENALRDILASAELGYCVVGSDIAGFSGRIIPPRLYIRWAQFSTFCGLFMNGGHGERALWKRSRQELEIIRKFSWLHTELIPYMYSHVVHCHNGGKPLQRPVDGTYHYLFGDDLLVAPIYVDTLYRSVTLPKGTWHYFFNDLEIYEGNQTHGKTFPLDEYPVFIKRGAIIPMHITRSYTGLGDERSEGLYTLLIYPDQENSFDLYHPDGSGKTVIRTNKNHNTLTISLNGQACPHILRVNSPFKPHMIQLNDEVLQEQSWRYDADQQKIIISSPQFTEGEYKIILPPA